MRTFTILPEHDIKRSIHVEEAYVMEDLASARLSDGVDKRANPILDVRNHAGMILVALA